MLAFVSQKLQKIDENSKITKFSTFKRAKKYQNVHRIPLFVDSCSKHQEVTPKIKFEAKNSSSIFGSIYINANFRKSKHDLISKRQYS